MLKPETDFSRFAALDIRVGTIVDAQLAATKKPTLRMTIDFGSDIGQRKSCGAFTNYPADTLCGKQVVAVINFGAKRMGPEISEVLVLGVMSLQCNGPIFITIDQKVSNGSALF